MGARLRRSGAKPDEHHERGQQRVAAHRRQQRADARRSTAFALPGGVHDRGGLLDDDGSGGRGLRAYLLKGGFVIFDDFRGNFRGGGGWENFETNMLRVLPGARIVDLDPKHPIFHSFFEIDSFEIIPQYYDQGAPVFRGIFENNDPTKRLLAMVNFNTDVSNYWEFSATGLKPIDESNQAYKLGVNYLVYGLTH